MKRVILLLLTVSVLTLCLGSCGDANEASSEPAATDVGSNLSNASSVKYSGTNSDLDLESESETKLESLISRLDSILSDMDIKDYEITSDDSKIEVFVAMDEVSYVAVMATSGISAVVDSWGTIKGAVSGLSERLQTQFDSSGLEDYDFCFSFGEEIGTPLLTYENGTLTYDYVEEASGVHADELSPSVAPSPSATPAPSVLESPEIKLPDFETLKFSGTGDSVLTDIKVPTGAIYYAYISHSGRRNFSIWVYDESEDRDLAVNEIGNFSGYYLFTFDTISRIEITADGNWEIAIGQLTMPPDSSEITSLSGSGPYVSYIFDAPSGVWTFTHDGSSNFIVHSYVTDGTSLLRKNRDMLVNEIGSYSGEQYISVPAGMHLILSIEADGNWSADLTG